MILLIKADEAEVYLGLWKDNKEVTGKKWEPGRELSVQILSEIDSQCKQAKIITQNLEAIVVYEGPGSYTGLRISFSVANTLGYTNSMPAVGSSGNDWIKQGFKKLKEMKTFVPLSPAYGGEVYTTKPKK